MCAHKTVKWYGFVTNWKPGKRRWSGFATFQKQISAPQQQSKHESRFPAFTLSLLSCARWAYKRNFFLLCALEKRTRWMAFPRQISAAGADNTCLHSRSMALNIYLFPRVCFIYRGKMCFLVELSTSKSVLLRRASEHTPDRWRALLIPLKMHFEKMCWGVVVRRQTFIKKMETNDASFIPGRTDGTDKKCIAKTTVQCAPATSTVLPRKTFRMSRLS